MKGKSLMPTLDELIKKYPAKSEEEIGETHFESDEEEEEADLLSNLLPFEEKYYDELGNWIGDKSLK